jgi:hypothetical protein
MPDKGVNARRAKRSKKMYLIEVIGDIVRCNLRTIQFAGEEGKERRIHSGVTSLTHVERTS